MNKLSRVVLLGLPLCIVLNDILQALGRGPLELPGTARGSSGPVLIRALTTGLGFLEPKDFVDFVQNALLLFAASVALRSRGALGWSLLSTDSAIAKSGGGGGGGGGGFSNLELPEPPQGGKSLLLRHGVLLPLRLTEHLVQPCLVRHHILLPHKVTSSSSGSGRIVRHGFPRAGSRRGGVVGSLRGLTVGIRVVI